MVAASSGRALIDGRRQDGGLAFDLLSSYSGGGRVTIGHADGVITIDLVESLDAYRESLRVHLGEPYRTMLGHFRHEVGHYYQNVLVESDPGAARYLDGCREIFGDERADYQAEIARHYKFGAPASWTDSYISEYATMHPWEDFAECFAHYLHITDIVDTSREAGLVLHADRVRFSFPRDIVPPSSYDGAPIEQLLDDWKWLSLFFNRVNAAIGQEPALPVRYPATGGPQAGVRTQSDPRDRARICGASGGGAARRTNRRLVNVISDVISITCDIAFINHLMAGGR